MIAQDPASLRRQLKYSWTPFFTRYGRLTEIQTQTVPRILGGINVVASAPTASGKTESIVAPVAERCVSERWKGLSTVYIVPTRALANDTLHRIKGPLEDMGLTVVLKHGDKPNLPSTVPDWLITTPESLDSLLCRKTNLFSNLRTVIIDEIHLIDNTYRGDQLRLLLWRLKKLVAQRSLAIHLLSATLPDPEDVARRYTSNFELISVGGQRQIEYSLLGSHAEIHKLARESKWKKVLYFCNRRASVEKVADELRALWKPYPVVVHHGSLARNLREEAEQVMKENSVALCVATSTLEIGIDIGNIDLVVLDEPPWSISSLLQRVGRGNRRTDKVQAAAIARSASDKQNFQSMFDLAESGVLSNEPYKADLSVAVQQTLSYTWQNRASGITHTEMISFLSEVCSEQQAQRIIEHLDQSNLIQLSGSKWYCTTQLMDEAEKGCIHSNIPDQGEYKVIDIETGQEIGTISGEFDNFFLLACQPWEVVSSDYRSRCIRAKRVKSSVFPAVFGRHRGNGMFHHLLPPSLQV
jgi:ATP-dependent helicase Lhr and Lhr-like helicase